MSDLLFSNMMNAREEYLELKKKYLDSISDYCFGVIAHPNIIFKGNKMYVKFEAFTDMSPRFMLDFCNEFGFLAPLIEIKNIDGDIDSFGTLQNRYFTIYEYKFIKILD